MIYGATLTKETHDAVGETPCNLLIIPFAEETTLEFINGDDDISEYMGVYVVENPSSMVASTGTSTMEPVKNEGAE